MTTIVLYDPRSSEIGDLTKREGFRIIACP